MEDIYHYDFMSKYQTRFKVAQQKTILKMEDMYHYDFMSKYQTRFKVVQQKTILKLKSTCIAMTLWWMRQEPKQLQDTIENEH